jgi:1-pyrroline-5-carboxylate dehydrogenase
MTASRPTSKVTYVTLAGNEEANAAYDVAVAAVRASLGVTHANWIDGAKAAKDRPLFDDLSPADTSVRIGRFPRATAADVGAAIEGARRAFPAWGGRPWTERVAILRRAAEAISSRMTELAALMSLEVGKNRLEAMGDAEEAADLLRYY